MTNDISSEITDLQKDLFVKTHSWRLKTKILCFISYIIDYSVCDQFLAYLKKSLKKCLTTY